MSWLIVLHAADDEVDEGSRRRGWKENSLVVGG